MEWTLEALLQLAVGVATAFATVALVYFTRVLARETRRLSDATSQPLVVATIEPNEWSMMHIDLRIENTGNAPAFDVMTFIDPPIGQPDKSSKGGQGMDAIDVLRPSQFISSFVAEAKEVLHSEFSIKVTWKKHPSAADVEEIRYRIDMKKWEKLSRLGPQSPLHQIAEQLKRSREDWRYVAQGQRRVKIDTYSEADRTEDLRRREVAHQELLERRKAQATRQNGQEAAKGGTEDDA